MEDFPCSRLEVLKIGMVVAKNTADNRSHAPPVAVHTSGVKMNAIWQKQIRSSLKQAGLMAPEDIV